MAYTPSMNRLIQELSKLPGIGEKTAARLAFHVLRTDRSFADGLADALKALKEQTRLCADLPWAHRDRSVPDLRQRRARVRRDLRRRGARRPDRDRALARLSRPLSRAAGRALAARRRRPRGSADRRAPAASARRHGARGHPRHQSRPSKARPPRSTSPGSSSPSACASPASRTGFPWGATSSTPTS